MNSQPIGPEGNSSANSANEEKLFKILDDYWTTLRRVEKFDSKIRGSEDAKLAEELQGGMRALDGLREAARALSQDTEPNASSTISFTPDTPVMLTRQFLPPDTKLGECRVLSLLGYGGMGEVYLAQHEVMDRKVAVKVLSAELNRAPNAVQRFRKEVQLQARLNPHPNLVTAMHASEHRGRLYLVMEYVPGSDLAKRMRNHGPLGIAEACNFVRQAACGLDYAHQNGLVHRDIKPSNLMLSDDGTVKLLDL